MVTNERIRELFIRLSIRPGWWVALSEEKDSDGKPGRFVTTGSSRNEVEETVRRMRGYKKPDNSGPVLAGDVIIVQNT